MRKLHLCILPVHGDLGRAEYEGKPGAPRLLRAERDFKQARDWARGCVLVNAWTAG